MGFHVEFVDIGGGLGVDYDGTRSSSSESSMNYSVCRVCQRLVSALVVALRKNNLPATEHHHRGQDGRLPPIIPYWYSKYWKLPRSRYGTEKEELGENPHELVDELYKIWMLAESWLLES